MLCYSVIFFFISPCDLGCVVLQQMFTSLMNDYDIYYDSSVSDMMIKLDIPPLVSRRKVNRLTNFHKAREGTLAVPLQK